MEEKNKNKNNIISGQDCIDGISRGVKLTVDLIRDTYGGAGQNVIVESNLRPGHGIYNDAWSIIKGLKFTDPAERRGLDFVKEVCERTDKMSGDNRKTTCILLDAILTEGRKSDMQKIKLKKELDNLIPFIENEIDKQTSPITVDEITTVATTASENEETGKLLQEIYQQIGRDGIIDVEGSGTFDTSYKITNGIKFEMAGYLSESMANNKNEAIYENPLILVTKKKITTDDDINPLLWEMEREGRKDLVIFTNDMDSGVASMLIDLHKSKKFNILIIKAPSLWQDYYFEDFAKCTGSTIVEDATGLTLRKLPWSALGTCGKIIVDQDDTLIMGTADISEHMAHLEAKGDDDSKLRLSWLNNQTAKVKLGSNSDTDLSYKLLKFKDAIRSSHLALKYGTVRGGGLCLDSVADIVDNEILKNALKVPRSVIVFNAQTLDVPDTIVDSAMTVKMAVRNAIGIASTILTAGALTYIPQLSAEEMAYQIAMSKNNAF